MTKRLYLALIIVLAYFSLSLAQQHEELTIGTYYPSPEGIYNSVRLNPHSQPLTCLDGEMYFDSVSAGAFICVGGSWQPLGGAGGFGLWGRQGATNYIYNLNSGNVGIGTGDPAFAKLEVNGLIQATGSIRAEGDITAGGMVVGGELCLGPTGLCKNEWAIPSCTGAAGTLMDRLNLRTGKTNCVIPVATAPPPTTAPPTGTPTLPPTSAPPAGDQGPWWQPVYGVSTRPSTQPCTNPNQNAWSVTGNGLLVKDFNRPLNIYTLCVSGVTRVTSIYSACSPGAQCTTLGAYCSRVSAGYEVCSGGCVTGQQTPAFQGIVYQCKN